MSVCVWAQTADHAARARARALTDTQSAQCLSQQPANQIARSAGPKGRQEPTVVAGYSVITSSSVI